MGPTKLTRIITTANVEVVPGPNQNLLLFDKTVELWQWDTPKRLAHRVKRWIRSRHILWIFEKEEKEGMKKHRAIPKPTFVYRRKYRGYWIQIDLEGETYTASGWIFGHPETKKDICSAFEAAIAEKAAKEDIDEWIAMARKALGKE